MSWSGRVGSVFCLLSADWFGNLASEVTENGPMDISARAGKT